MAELQYKTIHVWNLPKTLLWKASFVQGLVNHWVCWLDMWLQQVTYLLSLRGVNEQTAWNTHSKIMQ